MYSVWLLIFFFILPSLILHISDADKFAPRLLHRRQHQHIRQQLLAIDETIVPITVDVVNEEAAVKSEKISSPLTVEVTTQKVNRLIIQNDTEDEEELRKEVERSTTVAGKSATNNNNSNTQSKRRSQKRRHVSPIKFDIKPDDEPKRPKSSGGSPKEDITEFRSSKNNDRDEFRLTSTKRAESSRKYDNIPPCKFIFHFR